MITMVISPYPALADLGHVEASTVARVWRWVGLWRDQASRQSFQTFSEKMCEFWFWFCCKHKLLLLPARALSYLFKLQNSTLENLYDASTCFTASFLGRALKRQSAHARPPSAEGPVQPGEEPQIPIVWTFENTFLNLLKHVQRIHVDADFQECTLAIISSLESSRMWLWKSKVQTIHWLLTSVW